MTFVSKEETPAAMKRELHGKVPALPSNPFPDSLTVIPKHPADVEEVAFLFKADPASGIDKIDYSR